MQLNKQILAQGGKMINFFLPVYKPAGMCGLKLGEACKLDYYFVMEHHKIGIDPVHMAHSRYLEAFASGVTTFAFGAKACAKCKNFILADNEYELTIEFGVERHLHTIDGPVIGKHDISHLNEMKIRNQLPSFVGGIQQNRLLSYRIPQDDERDPLTLLKDPDSISPSLSATEIMNEITLPPKKSSPDQRVQKYPYMRPRRESAVKVIELVEYHEPYGQFRISANGSFIVRRFVTDLAASLNTHASLVCMKRIREGPMVVDDQMLLQPHELHLDYYADRLPIYKQIYEQFHRELDPLWDNIKT